MDQVVENLEIRTHPASNNTPYGQVDAGWL